MMLMFQLERRDVLPVDDFGVRNGFRLAYGLKGMPTPRALAQYGERWKPWRSVAAWYLWRACELARDGKLAACVLPPRLALVKRRAAKKQKKAPRKQAQRKEAQRKKTKPAAKTLAKGRRGARARAVR
jgi:hypothetical protein